MTYRLFLVIVLALGCSDSSGRDFDKPIPPEDLPDLETANLDCQRNKDIDADTVSHQTLHGLDSEGIAVCLRVDTSELFGDLQLTISSEDLEGDLAFFDFALFSDDGSLLRKGYDLTVGNIEPETRAHLDYTLSSGPFHDVILFVRARSTYGVSTEIEIQAYEIFVD